MIMIKKYIISALCLVVFTANCLALDAGDQVKMVMAKQKLYAGKYAEALAVYKEVLQKNPTDATVLHYVGLCNFQLKKNTEAEESLKKAIETGKDVMPESYLVLGKIHLNDAKTDEALTEFTKFKSLVSAKVAKENDADLFISYANNAKKFMANPINVKIDNLGSVINSKYDDQTPCISADGKKLVFNTRRPETTNSPMDVEGDGKYFQDIYIAIWDTINNTWKDVESVPGNVNTDAHDACTSISPDGKQIYIYKNDVNNTESRGGDVFVSKVVSNKWKTPEPMGKPINTTYFEGGACISADGKTLFFTSERSGGYGNSDIWMVKRLSKNEWGKPENLGPIVNSEYDEVGVFIAPDGKSLFFSSNGMGSMGSYDMFRSSLVGSGWLSPVNIGFPMNTVSKDGPFNVSADAMVGYFASDRAGGLGESDIYKVDLSNYGILETDFIKKENTGLSILKGVIRDSFEGNGLPQVEIKVLDANGVQVGNTTTSDSGEYFITLKGDVTYTIKASKKGYKTSEEKVELKASKNSTFSLEKQLMLVKEK